MTAFAAVLQMQDDPPAIAEIAEAIRVLTGTTPSIVECGRCAIVAAAPRGTSGDSIAQLSSASVVAAGQIIFEDHRQLSATLGAPAHVTGPALVGAAYEKWRDRCTEHLSGEYAFALWDSREQTLVSARDGLGIRLLYVAESRNAIVVTNVLAAAVRHPSIAADLDEVGLIAFLATGGAADDVRTCYRDVKVLPPGHTLIVRPGGASRPVLRRHWQFPLPDGLRRSEDEILEEYRSVLASAVRDRLATGDTAIFLSGGIDSTTIAAAARDVRPAGGLRAITTRYPRYIDDFELPFTRMAAEHLDLPLTVIDADRYEPWLEDPADTPLAAPLDEPSLADWRDAVAAAAQHARVALYGEDGDALLRPPGWRGLRNALSVTAIGMAAARYAIRERKKPYVGLRWRERLRIVPRRGEVTAPSWLSARAHSLVRQSAPGQVLGQVAEPLPPHPTRPEAQASLTSTNISRSFATTIAPETTRRPVELRLPILDSRLVKLVVSVPAIPWSQHKTLPRKAFRGRLPRAILDRPKTPLNGYTEAFVATWRLTSGGRMTPPGLLDEWVDARELARTVQLGGADAVMAAWRVGALERWLGSRPARTAGSAECIR